MNKEAQCKINAVKVTSNANKMENLHIKKLKSLHEKGEYYAQTKQLCLLV